MQTLARTALSAATVQVLCTTMKFSSFQKQAQTAQLVHHKHVNINLEISLQPGKHLNAEEEEEEEMHGNCETLQHMEVYTFIVYSLP